MSTLTVAFHFEIDGLLVAGDMAGNRQEFEFRGHKCAILIPRDDDDFGAGRQGGVQRCLITPTSWTGSQVTAYSVNVVRVEVEVASSVTASDLPSGGPHSERAIELAQVACDTAGEIAFSAIQRYVNRVRIVTGQMSLASSTSELRAVFSTDIRDEDGKRLAVSFGYHPRPILAVVDDDGALNVDDSSQIAKWIGGGLEPDLADSLLADAHFLIAPNTDHDRRLALLLAAIGCEVKIKDTLLLLATDEQRSLVELLLSNPRDFSMAASSLFDKPLNAICGRSLREDNKKLFKAVVALFKDRNAIAHRGGAGISTSNLAAHVGTAQAVFRYLDQISLDRLGDEASRLFRSPARVVPTVVVSVEPKPRDAGGHADSAN